MSAKIKWGLSILGLVWLCCSRVSALEVIPEFRVAFFYPTDENFRDIYPASGLYSLETNVRLSRCFYTWGSVGYFHSSGKSLGQTHKTSITVVPIGLGLKYLVAFRCIYPYIGAGVLATYAHVHNECAVVTPSQSAWRVGGIFKSGFMKYMTRCILMDFFLDYTYQPMDFHKHPSPLTYDRSSDLNGIAIGAGIRYSF